MPFRVFVSSHRTAKGEDTKSCLFVVTSTFAFRGDDTKTRQTKGDNTKDFYTPTRNFQQRNFRAFACYNVVISPSIFRVFVSSPESRKAKTRNMSFCRYFDFQGADTKT